jgi:predicted CoA-substrate-specific enzyme activase
MIAAGCDIGSLTAKAVIVKNGVVLAHSLLRTEARPAQSAASVMRDALDRAGLDCRDLAHVTGTGYGRKQIPFACSLESEITCHGRGVHHLLPSAGMVIDIGGQDAKAIRLGSGNEIARYIYNDKCASGTGRFLEIMAEALEVPLGEMGAMGSMSTENLTISSQCVIFAETEVVSLVNEGKAVSDVINALHHALARRVASMARSIDICEDVVLSGGVAKNGGIFSALSEALGVRMKRLDGFDPQLAGALGAALCAADAVAGG